MDIEKKAMEFNQTMQSIEVLGVIAGLGIAGFALFEVINFIRQGVFGSGSLPENFTNATQTLYNDTLNSEYSTNKEKFMMFEIKRFFYRIHYAGDISKLTASGAWFHIGIIEASGWKDKYDAVMAFKFGG